MTDEQFNGLLDYLSQNVEKIFAGMVKERDELIRETKEIREHNRKVAELDEAIRKTDEELARRDRLIREMDVAIEERDRKLRELDEVIEERDRRIRELERQLEDCVASSR